ncbi:MAG: glycosyltransferase family 4 protein, partial [Promethearchaeota archaeon]
KPLFSDKVISLYNLKYRFSIKFLSLFKKTFYHHTLSFYAKKFLENFFVPNKVIHITHGINLNNYIDITPTLHGNLLRFLYVGYLDDIHKGLGILIQALENYFRKNLSLKVHFEFCGKGPLEKKIQYLENKHPHLIKFNGYIPPQKIHKYYKKNDVLLFTSRREPFPRTLMEALAAGLFIACSKTIGSVELLKGKSFAYFFPKLTYEEIINTILKIYDFWSEKPDEFLCLRKEGKEYLIQNYSIDIEIQMFKELIERILSF